MEYLKSFVSETSIDLDCFHGDIVKTISIEPGSLYAFGDGINLSFTHEVHPSENRICIVIWGQIEEMVDDSGWEIPSHDEIVRMMKKSKKRYIK